MFKHILGLATAAAIVGSAAWTAVSPSIPAGAAQDLGDAASDAPTEYAVDPVHSSIVFRIKHLDTAYVYGRFNEMEGTVRLDPDNLEQSRIEIEVPAESIDTNNERRDNHLRSDDFFDVEQHDTLRFVSTSIEQRSADTFRVTGDMTIRGKTKEIAVDVKHTGSSDTPQFGKRSGWHTEFTIDRMDFGVDFMPDGLGHDVKTFVSIEAVAE